MSYFDIYFAVTSIATIAVAGLVIMSLLYVLAILHDIKRVSKIAKRETEMIARSFAKGASLFGTELSGEAAGFLRTIFALLLSHFGVVKSRRARKEKIKTI